MATQRLDRDAKPPSQMVDVPVRSNRYKHLLIASIIAALAVSLWLRIVGLNYLPGLNGDEAWSGVQALRFLRGEPFAWRTPTGNPINLFFWGPLVALHAIFPPSIGLLRAVSVASGILALAVNYWLCRKTFDQPTAIVSTVLLAVLPVNIAYSRFAWDSSQTLLASTLVVYAALSLASGGRLAQRVYLMLALAAAVVVHPTNLFLMPLVAVCCWQRWIAHVRQNRSASSAWPTWWIPVGVIVGIIGGWLAVPRMPAVLEHLVSPADAWRFVLDWERLLAGTTIYRFISGGVTSGQLDFTDLAAGCLLIAAAITFFERVKTEGNSLDRCLGVGLVLSLVVFYLVAGPHGVEPHFERYAIWTIAPATLLIARSISWGLQGRASTRHWTVAVSGAAVLALLVGFYGNYVYVFEATGGTSHLAFRTADRDPKQSAFDRIRAEAKPGETTWIVSANWWTRLPLEYFSLADDNVRVVKDLQSVENQSLRETASNVWLVELAGSPEAQNVEQLLQSRPTEAKCIVETDRAGNPVVLLFHLGKKSSHLLKFFSSP